MKKINYNLKLARKECRERAIAYNQTWWPLAWNDEKGFYAVEEWNHNFWRDYFRIEPMQDNNIICDVAKDGRFIFVRKKEYIKRFRLTDNQHQKGQETWRPFLQNHEKRG